MSKHFCFACYKELVEEKTADGQMGPGRRQRAVRTGDCGATGVEFVANKLVIKEGSGCGGEWGAVCNKRQWWNGAAEELML